MRKLSSLLFLCLIALLTAFSVSRAGAQEVERKLLNRKIEFPNIPGYKTLICDFHQHTIFSDGEVWPEIRIRESLADGLDAMSITDHIEYEPHSDDIHNADKNRVYQLALKAAGNTGLLSFNGAEITREMPPGHANAIFLQDANKLVGLDSIAVFREAKKQGAFITWNHPHWYAQSPNGTAVLSKMHKLMIKEGLIQGIEIVNEHSYSDEALKIANDNKLTLMSGSDIHDLIDWQFDVADGGHRPVTLVFATEKTEDAVEEALIKGRTVVWFDNTLVGKQELLIPLIQQSLLIRKTEFMESHNGKSTVVSVVFENKSDADYIFENQKDFLFYNHADVITFKAHSITTVQVKAMKELKTFTLRFRVLNAVTMLNTHPVVSFNVYTVQN